MESQSLSMGNAVRKTTKGEELLEVIQVKTKTVIELNGNLSEAITELKSKLNAVFGERPENGEKLSQGKPEINVPRDKGSFLDEVFYQLNSLEYEIEKTGNLHTQLRHEIGRLNELI
jgi:hypothetical protein